MLFSFIFFLFYFEISDLLINFASGIVFRKIIFNQWEKVN